MTKAQLLEIMRISYTTGINDEQNGGGYWCQQGSLERVEEIFDDLSEDGEIAPDMIDP